MVSIPRLGVGPYLFEAGRERADAAESDDAGEPCRAVRECPERLCGLFSCLWVERLSQQPRSCVTSQGEVGDKSHPDFLDDRVECVRTLRVVCHEHFHF